MELFGAVVDLDVDKVRSLVSEGGRKILAAKDRVSVFNLAEPISLIALKMSLFHEIFASLLRRGSI